jgi:hypothetical protein
MNAELNEIREDCITNVENYFCTRIIDHMDCGNLFDAQAIHEEFVIDEEDVPKNWLFLNDFTCNDY